jgi:hypothetical protein
MCSLSAHNNYIRRLETLWTLGNFELYLVAFIKGFKSVSLDSGEVNEYVVSIVLGNKSKALLLIKPFYTTFGHYNSPPFFS